MERIVPGLLYVHVHGSERCVGGHSTMSILALEYCVKIVTATCDVACFNVIRRELGLMMVINATLNCRC